MLISLVRLCAVSVCLGGALVASPSVSGEGETRPIEVDVELVLAADRSASISRLMLVKQRQGFAEAFRNDRLYRAIRTGHLGRIAVTYFEWSDLQSQHVRVPWMVLESPDDMARFADAIEALELGHPSGETSISGAMITAQHLLAGNQYTAHRRVVDISANGPNSDGPPVNDALHALKTSGTTVNGLVLSEEVSTKSGEALIDYFAREVIGGPGAFAVQVEGRRGFSDAILRKLVMEVAWHGG